MNNRQGIKAKLLYAFITINVIVLAISTVLDLYANFMIQSDLIESRHLVISQQAADIVRGFIEYKVLSLEKLGEMTDLAESDIDDARLAMDRLVGNEKTFRNLILLDMDKNELTRASRVSQTVSFKTVNLDLNAIYSRLSAANRYIGDVYINQLTYEPMIIIAVPVSTVLGETRRILAAEVNLKFMWELVDGIELGEQGVV
jgi:methyl-accepting chemotaxis protein